MVGKPYRTVVLLATSQTEVFNPDPPHRTPLSALPSLGPGHSAPMDQFTQPLPIDHVGLSGSSPSDKMEK